RLCSSFTDPSTTDTYTLSLHDALPISDFVSRGLAGVYDLNRNEVPGSTERDRFYWRDVGTIESFFDAHQDLIAALPIFNLYNREDRKSTRLNSSHVKISYAVFCLKKKK